MPAVALAALISTFALALRAGAEESGAEKAAGANAAWPSVPSVEDATGRLEAKGYTDVKDIERDRGGYEIKARDANVAEAEVFVDAETGEINATRGED